MQDIYNKDGGKDEDWTRPIHEFLSINGEPISSPSAKVPQFISHTSKESLDIAITMHGNTNDFTSLRFKLFTRSLGLDDEYARHILIGAIDLLDIQAYKQRATSSQPCIITTARATDSDGHGSSALWDPAKCPSAPDPGRAGQQAIHRSDLPLAFCRQMSRLPSSCSRQGRQLSPPIRAKTSRQAMRSCQATRAARTSGDQTQPLANTLGCSKLFLKEPARMLMLLVQELSTVVQELSTVVAGAIDNGSRSDRQC